MGPTASGKSDVAEDIALRLGAVLVNADAFQIYRGMDIGTAKPTSKERYRLLDLKNPNEWFGLGEWVKLAIAELEIAWSANRSVVVVGGTGLYIRALFEGYGDLTGPPEPGLRQRLQMRLTEEGLQPLADELLSRAPAKAATVDLKNPLRVLRALEKLESTSEIIPTILPNFDKVKFGIEREPENLRQKIQARTESMLRTGWIEEVAALQNSGYGPEDPGFRAHGYRSICAYRRGEMEYADLLERTVIEVRQYAKRQRTWLRREPHLIWLQDDNCKALAQRVLNGLDVG